jgi:hypothetical protein
MHHRLVHRRFVTRDRRMFRSARRDRGATWHGEGVTVDGAALARTREPLHAVAEHVLAADLYRHTGRIGLRAAPHGFGTPPFEVDGVPRRLRVEGTDLIVEHGGTVQRSALTTLAAAADAAGIEPGGPAGVYELATPLDPDRPLDLDPSATALLADWFALTDAALRQLVAEGRLADATEAQLWPEHFDLALRGGDANYGGSPGDDDHPLPYLYVGPLVPPAAGAFWNEPFGASLAWSADLGVEQAVGFFDEGRDRWAALSPTG